MEGIPSKARTLQMSLLMAKLYRSSRHTRFAITCYKECLRCVMLHRNSFFLFLFLISIGWLQVVAFAMLKFFISI
jgi:hypothetical protein